ncbi:PadR family transcriptional regulator [Bacillus sp. JCM 19041]|uniref:PadR family transcriptional regulator n=1 Tax=Bacillus sp. JCM 19041 TaxID=1460637 RepID=UPI0006CF8E69
MDKEMMKGSIDFLLLSLIQANDLYGYEMTKKLKSLSEESYSISEGTLYPALKRMEKKEWISSYWSDSTGARRKYYTITENGKTELARKKNDWAALNKLIKRTGESYEF